MADLQARADLNTIRLSPTDVGTVVLIVRRPSVGVREIVPEAQLDCERGLVGDSWMTRESSPSRDAQLTIMNSRVIGLLTSDEARWPLAGDQLFVDLDLSATNLPAGTRIGIGDEAIVEVTAKPHTGCGKFVQRFGIEAATLVNSAIGRELRLRGINAHVVHSGAIRVGDPVRKLAVAG